MAKSFAEAFRDAQAQAETVSLSLTKAEICTILEYTKPADAEGNCSVVVAVEDEASLRAKAEASLLQFPTMQPQI